jgi:hypothetical protein
VTTSPIDTEPKDDRTRVVLSGIDIPFGDLVIFYFKAALAAVPVAIAFAILFAIVREVVTKGP